MAGRGGRWRLAGAILLALWAAGVGLAACAPQGAMPAAPTPAMRAGDAGQEPAPQGPARQGPAQPAVTAQPLPPGAGVVTPTLAPGAREADALPGLDAYLAQLVAAFRAGDQAALAALGGNAHVNLAARTVRVILEMSRSPEAYQAGPPVIEVVTLANGQKVEIEHAAPVAIRADLAQAIAATGATYETAYNDWVQVLAPFGSLPALAAIPDVRLVRLPSPAGS